MTYHELYAYLRSDMYYDSGKLTDSEKCMERFYIFEASLSHQRISKIVKIRYENANQRHEKCRENVLKVNQLSFVSFNILISFKANDCTEST